MIKNLRIESPDFIPYDIVFEDTFSKLGNKLLECGLDKCKVCIITDSNVEPLYLNELENMLLPYYDFITSYTIPAGEESKTLDYVENIYEHLIKSNFTRKDILVALGGGVVGDMTGFVAATYMRGIDFIQVPTTLLSQVDSSIGGKTGVDFRAYKNMVGAFYQPRLVYINTTVLKTLPKNQFISGMGEVVKYGLIRDSSFYNWLKDNHEQINTLDSECLINMIYNCCNIKRIVVENDPKEKGERAILNFGHTLGHSIEKLMNFNLLHGECVSIGMVLSLYISYQRNNISAAEFYDVIDTFKLFNMPVSFNQLESDDIIETSKHDKKMEAGKVKFILLDRIGNAYIDRSVSDDEMRRAIEYVKNEESN